VVHSCLGDSDEVTRLLEEAYQEGNVALLFHLTHPLVDCVRATSTFTALLSRMKLEPLASYIPERPWRPVPTWHVT